MNDDTFDVCLFNFNALPVDLKCLLINVYLYPETSYSFLYVSKEFNNRFNNKIDRSLIIERYLKKKSWQQVDEIEKNTIICKKCYQVFETKKYYKGHLEKHLKYERSGKMWPNTYKKPEPCQWCGVRNISNIYHHCLLRKRECPSVYYEYINWLEHLCGLYYEMELNSIVCEFKCRECDFIFEYKNTSYYDNFRYHTKICPKRLGMISKYGILKSKIVNDGTENYEIWVCHYCDKIKHESDGISGHDYDLCTCICEICGIRGANKIVANDSNINFICIYCAKCATCGCKWLTSSYRSVWEYEGKPFCEMCSLLK